jgi:REP element-mobilizing transposase RayT
MRFRSQSNLFSALKYEYEHGGSHLKGKRKSRRPFNRKKPLHLVFRAEQAKGSWSFLQPSNRKKAEALLRFFIEKWQIRLYEFSFNSNHVHLLVRALDKHSLKGFLRSFPGALAMAITGAKKGNALLKEFWSERVYSRIVEWGRSFTIVQRYIRQNTLEALGVIAYTPRKRQRSRFGQLTMT